MSEARQEQEERTCKARVLELGLLSIGLVAVGAVITFLILTIQFNECKKMHVAINVELTEEGHFPAETVHAAIEAKKYLDDKHTPAVIAAFGIAINPNRADFHRRECAIIVAKATNGRIIFTGGPAKPREVVS